MKFNAAPLEEQEETLEDTIEAEKTLLESAEVTPQETVPETLKTKDPAFYQTQNESYQYSSSQEQSVHVEENPGYAQETIEEKRPLMDRILDPAQEIYEVMCEISGQVKIASLLNRKSSKHIS